MQLSDYPVDKLAVVMADGSQVITFGELENRSRNLADYFHSLGLRQGDHVAILMENRPEFLVSCWAAQRSGLLYTPVNWHLTEAEAAYVVADCGAQVLVAGSEVAELCSRVLEHCPSVKAALMTGEPVLGFSSFDHIVGTQDPDGTHDPIEGSYFFYSSGTTGRPKGIQLAHDYPDYGTGLRLDAMVGGAFGVNQDAVYLSPAPLYHAAPLGWTMSSLRHGATVVVMDRFEPVEFLRTIDQFRVTHMQVVPTMFVRLLKAEGDALAGYDTSSLKVVLHAGAPCPVEVKRRIIDWFGPVVVEYYAGSEGIGMTMIGSEEWLSHPGSVGRPVVGSIHIIGPDGQELPVGEVGSVYFAGGGSFSYHNDPEKTAAASDELGRMTLGDLGQVDDEGYLYLSDRRSDLILSGGVNIYPQEIENAIILHEAVTDVAVVGLSDEEMGQRVHAVIQLAPGVGSASIAETLASHCRDHLAGFKCPRSMSFVEELPRTPAGKLLRRRVREDLALSTP